MKKSIYYLLFILLFLFPTFVNATSLDKFNDKTFVNYFKNKGYEINKNECMDMTDYDKDCNMISAANLKGVINKTVELFIFNSNEESLKYFNFVYEDSKSVLKDISVHNFNNEDNSNYSYVTAELSGLYYFYLVRVDNYVIKSNIEKNRHDIMDNIYDGLGLIDNPNPKVIKNYDTSILNVCLFIFELLLIALFILALLKIKDNKKKKIVSCILGVLIVVFGIFTVFGLIDIFTPDNKRIKEEYESLNGTKDADGNIYPESSINLDNKIYYASSKEIVDIFQNNKKAVIFFGYPECLYCRSAIGTLIDAANEVSISKIYYLDVKKVDKNDKYYKKLVKILGNDFMDEDQIYSPLVIYVRNNGIAFLNKDTLEMHSSPYSEFTEQLKSGLKELYLYGFKVLDANT